MNKILFFTLLLFFSTTYIIAQKRCQCIYKKTAPVETPFHLYSSETEIVVLSYKDAYDTLWIISDSSNTMFDLGLHVSIEVKDNKHIIPETLDSIVLATSQKEKLFKILHLYQPTKSSCIVTNYACYEPHHLILFYQKKQIVAFIETCFVCYGNKTTENMFENIFMCQQKYIFLKDFFREIGIKHHLSDN